MMITKSIVRRFHWSATRWSAPQESLKLQMSSLRKKTGYTFSNIRKALDKHNNDVVQAEKWLHEQAQALGWSKAVKLEGRRTTQGLVAVVVQNHNAAMLEINCETDFVARNQTFQKMAELAARTCLEFVEKQPHVNSPLTEISLNSEQLSKLGTVNGKSLADQLALIIGSLGENASLARASCIKSDENVHLTGYSHPSGLNIGNVGIGRLGGLVAIKQIEPKEIDIMKLSKDLCQHIVGLKPKAVGSPSDKPAKNSEEEDRLIHQNFIYDESCTVKEVLEENGLEVVDFKRYECGENVSDDVKPQETIETCQ